MGLAGTPLRGLMRIALSLGLVAVLAACEAQREAILDLNPFQDTKDEFEGKFIETVSPAVWVPPEERIAAEKATASRAATEDKQPENTDPAEEVSAEAASSDDDEIAIGPFTDGLLVLRMDEQSIARAAAMDDYIAGIVARLQRHSPISGVPVRVYLTAAEDYGLAKAMPDGVIGIPLGVLRDVETEDELAFILAHEIAHVHLRHHDLDWFDAINGNVATASEVAIAVALKVGEATGNQTVLNDAKKAYLISQAVFYAADQGLFPSFTREQEDEADLFGLDLMVRAGYNPDGAFEAFTRFKEWQRQAAERARAARRSRAEARDADNEFEESFYTAMDEARASLTELWDSAGAAHRDPEAREESLLDYFLREYIDDVPPDLRTLELVRAKKSPTTVALFERYTDARTALKLTGSGKPNEAMSHARRAVSGAFSQDSLTRLAFYETRRAQNDLNNAKLNLRYALEGPDPALHIYLALAKVHAAMNEQDQAMAVLKDAFVQFREAPQLYPELINGHRMRGDTREVSRLLTQCRLRFRKLRKSCQNAADGTEDSEGWF